MRFAILATLVVALPTRATAPTRRDMQERIAALVSIRRSHEEARASSRLWREARALCVCQT